MADDDKTEDPTAKRQQESREKGQLGKSQDLNSAIIVALAVMFLYLYGQTIINMHLSAGSIIFGDLNEIDVTTENIKSQVESSLYFIAKAIFPFFLILFLASVVSNVTQIGLLLTFKTITPDFTKLDPIKGLKNKFSLKTVVMGLMNVAKVALFALVSYLVIKSLYINIFRMTGQEVRTTLTLFSDAFFLVSFYVILIMLILALADFAYQKWQNLQSMKMTKQEVKDEMKNYDGDPKIKQKRRQIQLQMSRQRMMKDVKDADVVITNPTHLSVALKYEEASMRAPIVVAKGADLLALRIREIAKAESIPLVENKPLARALYRDVEVGEPVPQKLFKAVAEILAYVYNLKNQNQQRARS